MVRTVGLLCSLLCPQLAKQNLAPFQQYNFVEWMTPPPWLWLQFTEPSARARWLHLYSRSQSTQPAGVGTVIILILQRRKQRQTDRQNLPKQRAEPATSRKLSDLSFAFNRCCTDQTKAALQENRATTAPGYCGGFVIVWPLPAPLLLLPSHPPHWSWSDIFQQ